LQAQVLGLSVDNVPTLVAWAESLGGITYPLLSDFYPHGEVAQKFGVLRDDGRTERAIFVIDKEGIIRYVDVREYIDDQPDNEDLFDVLEQLEPEAARAYEAAMPPPAPEPEGEVILYCTPWCGACRTARKYLDEHSIQYVEVNISRDRAAASLVRSWANGNETTPTFNINGTIIVNFDRAKLDKALGF
jgi:glutaredoxin